MKDKLIKNKKKLVCNFIIILIIFAAILMISRTIQILPGDDMVYKESFNNWSSFIQWSKLFLTTWGGRVIVLAITSMFLNLPLTIYQISNAIAIFTLIYAIYKMIIISKEGKHNIAILGSIFAMLLLINQVEFNESIIWMTGSFNYLWTAMTLCIALIPFLKLINTKEIKNWEYLLYIPATIFTCNFEQTGAIFVCFGIICLVIAKIDKIKINKGLIITTILGGIVTVASLLAVGNNVRYIAETIKFYPDFDMLSILDKLFLGTSITLNHLFNNATFIMLILAFEVCYLLFKKYNTDKTEQNKQQFVLSIIPLGYLLMRVIPFNQLLYRVTNLNFEQEISKLYKFALYNTELVSNPESFIQIIIGASISIFLAVLIYFAFKNRKEGIVYGAIYLAGLCASLVMGFSPTIFASSQRIFFINDMMLIIVTAGMLYEIIRNKQYELKEKVLFGILLVIGLLNIFKHI